MAQSGFIDETDPFANPYPDYLAQGATNAPATPTYQAPALPTAAAQTAGPAPAQASAAPTVAPTAATPGTPTQATTPAQAWQSSASGQGIHAMLKAQFPNMSDAELWGHLNFPQQPDARFLGTIINHIRALQAQGGGGAAGGGAAAGGGTPAAAGFNRGSWDQLIGNYPGTVAGLEQLVREHPELGLEIVGGSRGDIKLPSGEIIDVILAAGEGGRGWQWLTNPGGGGGGAGGGGNPIDPNSPLLAPWNKPFTPPPQTETIPGVPEFEYGDFEAPAAFKAPEGSEVTSDPGYQFRQNEAEQAFMNSAAARGVLRSGGTIKDFLKYGQEMASQEYGNVYNRRAGEYDRNFQNLLTDYTTDLGTARERYAPKLLEWQTRASDLRKQQELEYDRRWREYQNEMETYYRNQSNVYNRLYGTANLGQGAIY